jgi:translation initiation factor 1 (eIF-1/SUI1)
LEAQAKLEKDTAKKEAKAEAKVDAALKKKMVRSRATWIARLSLKFIQASQISIKRIERNKRKHVTAIHGLEAFGMFTALWVAQ